MKDHQSSYGKPSEVFTAIGDDAIVSKPSAKPDSARPLGNGPLTIHSTVSATQFEPELLTLYEAAVILRISEKTMYRLVAQREITFRRVGRGLRFLRRDIDDYLSRVRIDHIS